MHLPSVKARANRAEASKSLQLTHCGSVPVVNASKQWWCCTVLRGAITCPPFRCTVQRRYGATVLHAHLQLEVPPLLQAAPRLSTSPEEETLHTAGHAQGTCTAHNQITSKSSNQHTSKQNQTNTNKHKQTNKQTNKQTKRKQSNQSNKQTNTKQTFNQNQT